MMSLFLLLFTKEEFPVLTHLLLVFRRLQEGMGTEHLRPRWVGTKHQLGLQPILLVGDLVRENVDVQPSGRVLRRRTVAER
jgi:hypothetical protein